MVIHDFTLKARFARGGEIVREVRIRKGGEVPRTVGREEAGVPAYETKRTG